MTTDVNKLIADRERKFIEQRVIISQWVSEFMENIRSMDPALLEGIDIPGGSTAEELLPSLFTEPFDHPAYLVERAALETLRLQMNTIAERLNEEALQCLQS